MSRCSNPQLQVGKNYKQTRLANYGLWAYDYYDYLILLARGLTYDV